MKLVLIISVCAGLALGIVVWAAPAIQTSADTYAFVNPATVGPPCGSQLIDVRVVGNKTRLKLFNHALMVSEDSRLTGQGTVEVEVNINNVNGNVDGHGSLTIVPTGGHAGTWEADFNLAAPGGRSIDLNELMIVKDSHINARGTGEFAGQWFFFEHGIDRSPPYDIPVEDPDGPGGCEFAGEVWSGSILNPNAG